MSEENLEKFILSDRDLPDEMLDRYSQAPAIAVDTETMGLVLPRDRLCLVQLCDPDGWVTVIQIARGQTQAPKLKQILENSTILKVFHFARFDVAQMRYHLGIHVNPIFCTKIASKLARTYTSKHGLKDLIQELAQIELDKTAQSSDWGNPDNLSAAQLSYAANDVRYLLLAQTKLSQMLDREERSELAQRCFQVIPLLVELDIYQFQGIFEH
jgi:ribonuclease D